MPIKRIVFEEPPVKPKAKPTTKKQRRAKAKAKALKLSKAASAPKAGAVHEADDALSFDLMMVRAADFRQELDRLEANGKLSGGAFLKAALDLAKCDEARLVQLDAMLNNSTADACRAFVRRLVQWLRAPNCPSLPAAKLGKLVRILGNDDLSISMSANNVTVTELLALAVYKCIEAHPDAFGTCNDPDAHREKCEALRKRLDGLYSLMRTSYTAADVWTESRSLSEKERKAGHVVMRLRKYPSVHLGLDDWPQQAVAAMLRAQGMPKAKVEPEPAPVELSPETKAAILRQASAVVILQQSATMDR